MGFFGSMLVSGVIAAGFAGFGGGSITDVYADAFNFGGTAGVVIFLILYAPVIVGALVIWLELKASK